jgi:hypothetical protein
MATASEVSLRPRVLFAGACLIAGFASLLFFLESRKGVQAASAFGPSYAANGDMLPPANYREWIYVTSGMDMSYAPNADMAGHSMFDNVFVNPEPYRSFLKTGTWPDKTVMVLESRMAQSKGSINQRGHFQDKDVMAIEVHVKDEGRFPAKWAFFEFDSIDKNGTLVPSGAPCYTCHAAHGAVDTTFVQFYPTLLPIAQAKKTLSDTFLKEEAASAK